MRKTLLPAALAILIFGMFPPAKTTATASASMTVLDGLSSSSSQAYASAINNVGQIVGRSRLEGTEAFHAVVWNKGVPTDLGTLGGSLSQAYDINDTGDIVGESLLAGDKTSHAFLWRDGAMIDLGCLPGGSGCAPTSINNRGQIVGFTMMAPGLTHATLWANGAILDIHPGTVDGSRALTSNEQGEIGGYTQRAGGVMVATFWDHAQQPTLLQEVNQLFGLNNRGQALAVHWGEEYDSYYLLNHDGLVDLTRVNDVSFYPFAINDRGQIAGIQPSLSPSSVVVWERGTMISLGPLPGPYFWGFPTDLNNRGQVVGAISTAAGERAVVWTLP